MSRKARVPRAVAKIRLDFRRWLRTASHRRWVVYAKRPFGGAAQAANRGAVMLGKDF